MELLENGFSPTDDTKRFLRVVDDPKSGSVELAIQMRQSADGAGTWYALRIAASAGMALPWRKTVKKICCDDHAAAEDNIQELTWKRRHGKYGAAVSIGYFGSVKEKAYLAEQELLTKVAKRAADNCLSVDGAGDAKAP